jgi:aspartate 1-decarboxylase
MSFVSWLIRAQLDDETLPEDQVESAEVVYPGAITFADAAAKRVTRASVTSVDVAIAAQSDRIRTYCHTLESARAA